MGLRNLGYRICLFEGAGFKAAGFRGQGGHRRRGKGVVVGCHRGRTERSWEMPFRGWRWGSLRSLESKLTQQ